MPRRPRRERTWRERWRAARPRIRRGWSAFVAWFGPAAQSVAMQIRWHEMGRAALVALFTSLTTGATTYTALEKAAAAARDQAGADAATVSTMIVSFSLTYLVGYLHRKAQGKPPDHDHEPRGG